MRNERPRLDDYWTALETALPEFSPEQQHIAVALYRELAKGMPVTTERFADVLGVSAREAGEELARDPVQALSYADKGQIVGFGGLATVQMHHEFKVKGQQLWTWCAWDSLFIPELLGESAEVSSPDPESGELVRLTISPTGVDRVEPQDAVVSFLLPDADSFDRSAENVMASFCHHVFFFGSRESGERWGAKHEGTFLYSLEEAFELGRKLNEKLFGHELRRLSPASPGNGAVRRPDLASPPSDEPQGGNGTLSFQVHDVHSAPVKSRPTLEQVERGFGFVPNLFGVLAESPAALETYISVARAFDKSDLTPVERHVVLLSVSLENRCDYCLAAHSMSAKMTGVPDDVLAALRSGARLADVRLEALRRFTRAVVQKRGWLSAGDVEEFRAVGFTKRHVLEVLVGVALKTLSNYTNHLAHTPLDEAFQEFAWTERAVKDVAQPSYSAI